MQPDDRTSMAQPEPQQLLGYDAAGNPLYGIPASQLPVENLGTAFQTEGTAPPIQDDIVPRAPRRPDSPRSEAVQADVKEKHDQSAHEFPDLNLTDTEYVIMSVERTPLGMAVPVVGGLLLICLIMAGIILYPSVVNEMSLTDAPNVGIVTMIGILLAAIVAGFTYLSVWLFRANTLILTNESLVRTIQISLFSKNVRTVSLGDVGGVNYRQTGIMQTMFEYGTVHVNTRGNDNIYRMTYATTPKKQTAIIERAVEEFKERFGVDHRF